MIQNYAHGLKVASIKPEVLQALDGMNTFVKSVAIQCDSPWPYNFVFQPQLFVIRVQTTLVKLDSDSTIPPLVVASFKSLCFWPSARGL